MENVEEKPKVDIDAMCRMCHHQFDADKSVKIFDDELTASLPISVQIKIFTGVEVSSTDAMPDKLCLKCRLHLEKSNLVRNKFKNLEAKMRKHLRIINAGRVSRVFDDDDDDNEEEYIESIKVIDALSQQLDDDQNGNCKHQIDFESEKQRIFDEAQANFEQKLKAAEAEAQRKLDEVQKSYDDKLEKFLGNDGAENLLSLETELEYSIAARDDLELNLVTTEEELERKEWSCEEMSQALDMAESELGRSKEAYEELTETLSSIEAKLNEKEESCEELQTTLHMVEQQLERAEESYREHLDTLRKEVELERDYIATLTEAHEAELKRIKDEAEKLEKMLEMERTNGPPLKRKQSVTPSQMNPSVSYPSLTISIEAEDKNEDTVVNGKPTSGEIEKKNNNCREFEIDLFESDDSNKKHSIGGDSDVRMDDFEHNNENEHTDQSPIQKPISPVASSMNLIPGSSHATPACNDEIPLPKPLVTEPNTEESVSDDVAMTMIGTSPSARSLNVSQHPSTSQSVTSVLPNRISTQSLIESPAKSAIAPSMIKNLYLPVAGPSDIGKVTVQRKTPIQHPSQAAIAHENGNRCFTCKAVHTGGLSAKYNNVVRSFCSTACLSRANASQMSPNAPVASVHGNGKRCYTCMKGIAGTGISAKCNNVVYNFCDNVCFSRTQQTGRVNNQSGAVAARPLNTGLKFYCELCDKSYTLKGNLKTHFFRAHPDQTFNDRIVAIVRK